MFDLNYVFPLVGVIIGWLLNEFSELLRLRREDRRAIGRALADLMEIRSNLIAVKKTSEELFKRVNVSPQHQLLFRNFLDDRLPSLESLRKRYEESVNTVASTDPLLGFRLRSLDLFAPAVRELRSLASADKASSITWSQIETKLLERVIPHFEKLILELARSHGWRTWFRVRRRIRKPLPLPSGWEELMSRVTIENQPT